MPNQDRFDYSKLRLEELLATIPVPPTFRARLLAQAQRLRLVPTKDDMTKEEIDTLIAHAAAVHAELNHLMRELHEYMNKGRN